MAAVDLRYPVAAVRELRRAAEMGMLALRVVPWLWNRLPPALVTYLRSHGRRRVLFGTNWPMLSAARCLEHLGSLELDDETRDLFLGGNAARVFGL